MIDGENAGILSAVPLHDVLDAHATLTGYRRCYARN
jgi:hypothetical protein